MIEQATDIDVRRTFCLQSMLNFTRYFFKARFNRKFVVGQHHVKITNALDRVLKGECKRLIINIAPRYGKTELAVKNFIAMGLALNPAARFIHLSYSDDLARDNSRCVQEILRCDEFKMLFPECEPTSYSTHRWSTTQGGGLYAVSSGGQVTGFGAGLVDEEDIKDEIEALNQSSKNTFGGAIVIDDPIKPDDARSSLIREKVNVKFDSTIRNRVNSRNTPIVIIMQRLDANDLCGYLIDNEPDDWEVLSLPAIQIDENGKEQPLWEFKHNLEELHALREKNAFVFDTQYMQNPVPLEGLLYEQEWRTYDIIPPQRTSTIKCYIDTADTGADYLCAIVYDETPTANYVIDVLYTQKPMEYTEPATMELMNKYRVDICNIESNNGGRGFARNVERLVRESGNMSTRIKWFAQTLNKEVRIFTQSNDVQNMTYFPTNWEKRWPQFAAAVCGYMKTGRNEHDDAVDALTGTIEMRRKTLASASGYF